MTINGATGMFAVKSNQQNQTPIKTIGEGIGSSSNTNQKKEDTKDRKTIDASGWQSMEPDSISERKAHAQAEAFKISLAVFRNDMKNDDKCARIKADSIKHSEDARYQQEMARIAKENFETLREMDPELQDADAKEILDTLLHAYEVFSRSGDEFSEYKGIMSAETLQSVLINYDRAKPDSGETIYGRDVSFDDLKGLSDLIYAYDKIAEDHKDLTLEEFSNSSPIAERTEFQSYHLGEYIKRRNAAQNEEAYFSEINEDNIKYQEYGYQKLYEDYGDDFSFSEISTLIDVARYGMSDAVKDAVNRYGAERSFHNQGIDSLREVNKDEFSLKEATRVKIKSHTMASVNDVAEGMAVAANKETIGTVIAKGIENIEEESKDLEDKTEERAEKAKEENKRSENRKQSEEATADNFERGTEDDKLQNNLKQPNGATDITSSERFEAESVGRTISSEDHVKSRIANFVSAMGLSLEDIKGGVVDKYAGMSF